VSTVRCLLRRFAEDLISRADTSVARSIMSDDYNLHIGGHELAGRDEGYLAGVGQEFARFPDLRLEVHGVLASEHGGALAFTEHGRSQPHGRRAAWRGVAMFEVRSGRLVRGWAEEDYLARRHQLAGEAEHPIDPVEGDPWSGADAAPDARAEQVVRDWLRAGAPTNPALRYDDLPDGRSDLELPVSGVGTPSVDVLFGAEGRVAFHTTAPLELSGAVDGGPVTLPLRTAGLVDVAEGRVSGGRVVRDRAGLHRAWDRQRRL
jgi:predicted ester cyclase